MMLIPLIYHPLIFAQKVVLRLFADWKVTGVENVPPTGPLIVVANHQSNMDPSLLCASLPVRAYFLAKKNLFQGPGANWFLQSYGAYPLNRSGPDPKAYRWALNRLKNRKTLVLFPEGRRSRGSMKRGLPGVVHLALRSQVPLLPVGITGTEHIGTWLRVFNPTGRIRVKIGTVFTLPTIEGKLTTEIAQSMTDMIMRRIAALLPESYQGVYRLNAKDQTEVVAGD